VADRGATPEHVAEYSEEEEGATFSPALLTLLCQIKSCLVTITHVLLHRAKRAQARVSERQRHSPVLFPPQHLAPQIHHAAVYHGTIRYAHNARMEALIAVFRAHGHDIYEIQTLY
jgi:hypothetical protein